MGGQGQKYTRAYRVGGSVKVKAYVRWHDLLVDLPIIEAEGKCRENDAK